VTNYRYHNSKFIPKKFCEIDPKLSHKTAVDNDSQLIVFKASQPSSTSCQMAAPIPYKSFYWLYVEFITDGLGM
jgi:hypothetical protein